MAITYLVWLIRFYMGGGWNDILEMGGYAALIGILTFPIGSPFFIWIDVATVSRHLVMLSVTGYGFYLLIAVLGGRRQSLALFALLCALLIANIAGCQMNHTVESIPLSP